MMNMMVDDNMIEMINKIISYSKKNKVYEKATLDQIKHIEIKTGYSLPEGYSDLYSVTNGGKLFNIEFLEIDDVIKLLNDETYIEKEDMNVSPSGYVKKVVSYKNRIPLFRHKKDLIFIDLDPDSEGIIGQIVLYSKNSMKVIADSLKSFLKEASNNLENIYKKDLISYFLSNYISIENNKKNDVIKLNNDKIGIKVLDLDNNVFTKEFRNKKISINLFLTIINSFIRIINTFNERVKTGIIIFDKNDNHTLYNYFEYMDVYNNNNFTVTDINEYINKVNEIKLDSLLKMDFKLGLIYQIDDKINKNYINANHRLECLISKEKIVIKYVFNIKESYIYNEMNNIISYISSLEETAISVAIDETFLKLDKSIILDVCSLFQNDMAKYRFDEIDESKINYHSDINRLIDNIRTCNWIDPSYAININDIENKNINDLTLEELKKYFSSIIKREEIEKGYIAVMIDKGIFEKLVFRLKNYKEDV